jgi:hypothetical protein
MLEHDRHCIPKLSSLTHTTTVVAGGPGIKESRFDHLNESQGIEEKINFII